MKFSEFGLSETILEAISYMGFEHATPVQELAIPLILQNKDLIACAQTGTGKTAAFVLPILNKLRDKQDTSINTLVIVPTRELAVQIEQQIQGLSYFVSVGSIAIYGGGDGKGWDVQKDALVSGTDIIVATPGKLISHLKMGYVDFSKVKHLVLDEADRMLDMGFSDDLNKIISFLPKERQTLMFSATMPNQIRQLAKKILNEPAEISLSISKPAEGVSQFVCFANEDQKDNVLHYILKQHVDFDSIIVFTSAKAKVSSIIRGLRKNGYAAKGISSDLEQDQREEVLQEFRSKRLRILVATDVMSRGIDIKEINMVVNYDVPHDAEDYVHRVGRTARANTTGIAYTLVNGHDQIKLKRIEKLIDGEVPRMPWPEELGQAPDLKNHQSDKGHNKKKKFFKKKKSGEKQSSPQPKSAEGTSK
ncbi:MAG: DEAD/DEAH box helicase [Crocinitomicaceae bacterium]|nr:DEAD/DEAH box helicase [Crocinitomicaceae bacterium]